MLPRATLVPARIGRPSHAQLVHVRLSVSAPWLTKPRQLGAELGAMVIAAMRQSAVWPAGATLGGVYTDGCALRDPTSIVGNHGTALTTVTVFLTPVEYDRP